MSFTDIFIRKPVFAIVLSLIILLIGVRSYLSLPVRQFPEIDASAINISTTYPGAGANVMEGFVTTPLENALSGIDGIDYIQSSSMEGVSNITIYFRLGYDINKAITDVSNAVASARSSLPNDINDPIVKEDDPNAQPTMYIPFTSSQRSPEALTDYIVRVVQPQIATLPGVSQAPIFGERLYAMRIWLNPQQMAARGITADDVSNALSNDNIQATAGRIDSKWEEFDVNATTDLQTPQQFNNMVLKNVNGNFIRLRDVGYATLGAQDDRAVVRVGGKTALFLAVVPQSSGNPLVISKEVRQVLTRIGKFLPPDITINKNVIWDLSRFIAQSLTEVYHTILEAIFCVVLVIFLFLGSPRSTLIPVITIPLSIIGVCSFMLALGYSINILTLLACVLAIGLVVDDAIVVVENIHRHIEAGMKPFDAAIKGAREIGFAIVAMTLTLACVYAPIGFISGLTGALFREFAFTLAGAVIISGFIALTLSPMMCSKLMKPEINRKGLTHHVDQIFHRCMQRYKRFLGKTLNKRIFVLIIAAIIYISCYLLYTTLPTELAPTEDQGAVMMIATGPSSSNLNYTMKYTKEIENIFKSVPEGIGYGVINGFGGQTAAVNQAFGFLVLKPWDQRKRTAQQILYSLYPQFAGITGLRAFPFNLPSLPDAGGFTPVQFVLKTTGSYEELNTAVSKLLIIAREQNPALLNIDSDLHLDKAQVIVNINRNRAADLGIPMTSINNTLSLAFGQPQLSHFNMNGRSYDVIPQLELQYSDMPQQIGELNVRTLNGQLVPLSNIATIQMGVEPESLNHFQQIRSATITAGLAPGYTLGEALSYLENVTKKDLPSYVEYDFSGQSRQFEQATGAMEETFAFALIFIFLVLTVQFNSFRDPLIVMVSVPLSTAGALVTLHCLPGGTSNIYTQIGLVTLIGLISKHGILIVEFANQLQKQGLTKVEAVIEAASIRLRPVLMTTFATVLGAMPLALATGAGAEARKQLGWTIVGGMSFGTLFTLIVIPTVYSYLASNRHEKVEEKE